MSDDGREAGMEVRRQVLGDAHVDHAIERTTPPSTRSAAPVVADASREQT